MKVTNDPAAPKVQITEENIREKYPWNYSELVKRLTARYSDFTANASFHKLNKPLKADPRYCHARHLDPAKPSGMKKEFYSPNIVMELDKCYTLRTET